MSDVDFIRYLEVMEYKIVKTEFKQQNDKSTTISQSNAENPFQINPLQPSVGYLYPLKTSENLKVF